jgi:hypothetical protein
MQALKQAARENDSVRLDAVCDEWSVSPAMPAAPEQPMGKSPEPKQSQQHSEARSAIEARR